MTDLLSLPAGPGGPGFTALLFCGGAEAAEGAPPAGWRDLARGLAARGLPLRVFAVGSQASSQAGPQPGDEGIGVRDHTGRLFALYDPQPGTLYLVRPDGHVLGRWRASRAADIEAALSRALAR